MPLSEHEQKILEEIERRLAAEDPKFARQVAFPSRQGQAARRVRHAGFAFGAGFALLIAGLFVPELLVPFGLAAFGVMLGSVVVITTTVKALARERVGEPVGQRGDAWFNRLEERWRKRFERGDGR